MPSPEPVRRAPGFRHLSMLPIVSVEPDSDDPQILYAGGRRWHVAAEPVRWFDRASWWEDSWAPREVPAVDVEMLRLQARLGGPASQLVTFDLAHDRSGAWRLVSVDGEPQIDEEHGT